ncbi:hypothetical protein EPN83_00890 [Patescibacteria group bacterium]|nr:MAG: hypothetical protein EPN83_00890 [Patescibacteria group bacterium]
MRTPYWVRGLLFATFFVAIIFFLKIICPLETGCLADPFLTPLFSPLFLLEGVFGGPTILGLWEPLFIFVFWGLAGLLFGFLYGRMRVER